MITGIEQANEINGVKVFFAGVKNDNGQLIVSGGRVLNVTATGESIEIARDRAYKACELINFKGMHYRTDIASQAVWFLWEKIKFFIEKIVFQVFLFGYVS